MRNSVAPHHQVEHYDIGPAFALEDVERFLSIVRERDSERSLLQLYLDDPSNVGLVVGNKDVLLLMVVSGRHSLEDGGDSLAVTPDVEEQHAEIGGRVGEDA